MAAKKGKTIVVKIKDSAGASGGGGAGSPSPGISTRQIHGGGGGQVPVQDSKPPEQEKKQSQLAAYQQRAAAAQQQYQQQKEERFRAAQEAKERVSQKTTTGVYERGGAVIRETRGDFATLQRLKAQQPGSAVVQTQSGEYVLIKSQGLNLGQESTLATINENIQREGGQPYSPTEKKQPGGGTLYIRQIKDSVATSEPVPPEDSGPVISQSDFLIDKSRPTKYTAKVGEGSVLVEQGALYQVGLSDTLGPGTPKQYQKTRLLSAREQAELISRGEAEPFFIGAKGADIVAYEKIGKDEEPQVFPITYTTEEGKEIVTITGKSPGAEYNIYQKPTEQQKVSLSPGASKIEANKIFPFPLEAQQKTESGLLLSPYLGSSLIAGAVPAVQLLKNIGFFPEQKAREEFKPEELGTTQEEIIKRGPGTYEVKGGTLRVEETPTSYDIQFIPKPPEPLQIVQAGFKSLFTPEKYKIAKGDVSGAAKDIIVGTGRGAFETGAFFASAGAGAVQIIKTKDLTAGEKVLAESQRKSNIMFGQPGLGGEVLSGRVAPTSGEYNVGQLLVPAYLLKGILGIKDVLAARSPTKTFSVSKSKTMEWKSSEASIAWARGGKPTGLKKGEKPAWESSKSSVDWAKSTKIQTQTKGVPESQIYPTKVASEPIEVQGVKYQSFKSQLNPETPYVTSVKLGESRTTMVSSQLGKGSGRLLKPSEITSFIKEPKPKQSPTDFTHLTAIPLGKTTKTSTYYGGERSLPVGRPPPPPPDEPIQFTGKKITADEMDKFLSKGGTRFDTEFISKTLSKGSPIKSITSKPKDFKPLKLKLMQQEKITLKQEPKITLMPATETKIKLGISKNVLVIRKGKTILDTIEKSPTKTTPFLSLIPLTTSKAEQKQEQKTIVTPRLQQKQQQLSMPKTKQQLKQSIIVTPTIKQKQPQGVMVVPRLRQPVISRSIQKQEPKKTPLIVPLQTQPQIPQQILKEEFPKPPPALLFGPARPPKKPKQSKQESKSAFDWKGNVPEFQIEGVYKKYDIIYGTKRVEKLSRQEQFGKPKRRAKEKTDLLGFPKTKKAKSSKWAF